MTGIGIDAMLLPRLARGVSRTPRDVLECRRLFSQGGGDLVPNSYVMNDPVSQLRVALHQVQDWAYPDEVSHALFQAYMKTPHDVGGEPDPPARFEEK